MLPYLTESSNPTPLQFWQRLSLALWTAHCVLQNARTTTNSEAMAHVWASAATAATIGIKNSKMAKNGRILSASSGNFKEQRCVKYKSQAGLHMTTSWMYTADASWRPLCPA